MAEPGTDPAGGQEAPPPPQTETVDTAGSHATTPPQPPQTETVGPGPVPTPPLQNQTAAQPQVQPQPRPQTGTGEVAGQPRTPQPPSQVRASAADAEKQPPAPSSPPPKKPAHQTEVPKSLQPPEGGVAGDAVDKPTDSMQLPRGSRLKKMFQKKGRLVRCLMSWYGRHRSREEPVDKAAAAQKEKGEGTKPSTPAQGDAIEKQLPRGRGCRLKEMFQKKGRLIRYLMSWYRPYRSREEPMDNAAARKEKGEGTGTKPSTSAQEEGKVEEIITKQPSTPARGDKQLPCGSRLNELFQKKGRLVGWLMSWYRRHRTPNEPAVSKVPASAEEGKSKEAKDEGTTELQRKVMVSLEEILEEAFDGLLAADLGELSDKDRECLLTFSVFALASDVKKQAVTYWWATQFELHYYLSSDDVFKKLCGDGFLEPIKNRCSQVIHGCRVNPLVHWMVKRRARPKFADLDERGDPTDKQPNSEVLCLTAGNRIRLQRLPKAKGESKAARKLPPTTTNKAPIPQGQPAQNGETRPEEVPDAAELRKELKNKKVILNVSANVYRLPGLLLSESDLADRLVVLQLGRWWNSDDKTYMEVDGLESLRAIGNLKNLRYLSLRGLSQLKELPSEIRQLDRLAILDVRGCQNLVKVASKAIDTLKKLTHLDLTECYLLEHIGRGVTSLTELRVFKGFVFGVGPERWSKCCRSKVCRLHDLCKLKKLQKLSVNVTTDAKVDKGEMANLKGLDNLRSLTVTWGELPSILDEKEKEKEKKELLDNWTGLVLPRKLEKLDVRCFPEEVIPQRWFDRNDTLKKLYVRGGAVMKLEIPKNSIEILRLRYLKHFEMSWTALHEMLKAVKYVEVVIKDPKVMKIETQVQEDPQKKVQEDPQKVKEEQTTTTKKKKAKEKDLRLMADMKKKMGIPGSTLDENGVWVRDAKEEENKKGEGTQGGADKSNVPEPSDAAPAPAGKVPKSEAHKTEAAPGAAEVPREAGKGGGDAGKAQTAPPSSSDENKAQGEEGGQGGSLGGAEEADGPPTKEDGGDAPEVPGEVKKVDGGDAGKARTEGEGGQGGRPTTPRVSEKDGVDDDTSPADAARSPAAPQPPELPRRPDVPDVSSPSVSDLTEDASAKPVQANASASGTTPPPVPPATSTTAKPKEPGKADDDDGSN